MILSMASVTLTFLHMQSTLHLNHDWEFLFYPMMEQEAGQLL